MRKLWVPAVNALGRFGRWEGGFEGRWLQGRHSAAFQRNEYFNGNKVATDNYEVRLNQTGFALSLIFGRWF